MQAGLSAACQACAPAQAIHTVRAASRHQAVLRAHSPHPQSYSQPSQRQRCTVVVAAMAAAATEAKGVGSRMAELRQQGRWAISVA